MLRHHIEVESGGAIRVYRGSKLILRIPLKEAKEMAELHRKFGGGEFDLGRFMAAYAEERFGIIPSDIGQAAKVQFSLLPKRIPNIPHYDLRVHYQSAGEVSGDYYDFIPISSADGYKLGIIIADVSGKGVPAGMIMATFRAHMHHYAPHFQSPKETISRVNKRMTYDVKDTGKFITALYMIFDPSTNTLNYVRAGHNPLIHVRDSGVVPDTSKGMGIGMDAGDIFYKALEERLIYLSEGERIVAYTDGVTEAKNPNDEEFGEKNLLEIVQEHYKENSATLINRIMGAIGRHQREMPQHDDITMITFMRNA